MEGYENMKMKICEGRILLGSLLMSKGWKRRYKRVGGGQAQVRKGPTILINSNGDHCVDKNDCT